MLETAFKQHAVDYWRERFERGNVAAEITNPEFGRSIHDNPDMQRRGWSVAFEMPKVGRLDQIGDTFSMSRTPTVMQGRPVVVGRETKDLLLELGYTEKQIQELSDAKVILMTEAGVVVPNPRDQGEWGAIDKGAAA
jgi:crotonobetainyl-CoA:carnitine CoA-transferase CaiB-like acyl-CoA transferase